MNKVGFMLIVVVLLSGGVWFTLGLHYKDRIDWYVEEKAYVRLWDQYKHLEEWYLFSVAMCSVHVLMLVALLGNEYKAWSS